MPRWRGSCRRTTRFFRCLVQLPDFLNALLCRARDVLDALTDVADDVLVVRRDLRRVLALRQARLRDVRDLARRGRDLLDTGRRLFDAACIRLALFADAVRERLDLCDDRAILVDAPEELLRRERHFLRDAEKVKVRALHRRALRWLWRRHRRGHGLAHGWRFASFQRLRHDHARQRPGDDDSDNRAEKRADAAC